MSNSTEQKLTVTDQSHQTSVNHICINKATAPSCYDNEDQTTTWVSARMHCL